MDGCRLILVRHGQTEWNVENRLQGHHDSPLTELGHSQARATADRLAGMGVNAVVASDLGRAMRTAECIADACRCELTPDARLRERNLGCFEGLTWDEIRRCFAGELKAFRIGGPDYVIPGGESARHRHQRTLMAMSDIARRYQGRSLVVVAHAGTLDSAFRQCVGLPLDVPRRFSIPHLGLNSFTVINGQWTLDTWGDVAHLTDLLPPDEDSAELGDMK